MSDVPSKPIIYVKKACPFCMKVRIFLAEAGLLDQVEIRQFTPDTDEERAIRAELAAHLPKVSFPTALIRTGEYLGESDAIIAHFSARSGADPSRMPTLRAYADDLMPAIRQMFVENMELKKKRAA